MVFLCYNYSRAFNSYFDIIMIGLSKKRFGPYIWEDGSDLGYVNWHQGTSNYGDVDACVELDTGMC